MELLFTALNNRLNCAAINPFRPIYTGAQAQVDPFAETPGARKKSTFCAEQCSQASVRELDDDERTTVQPPQPAQGLGRRDHS